MLKAIGVTDLDERILVRVLVSLFCCASNEERNALAVVDAFRRNNVSTLTPSKSLSPEISGVRSPKANPSRLSVMARPVRQSGMA